jgi:hypothetical protein
VGSRTCTCFRAGDGALQVEAVKEASGTMLAFFSPERVVALCNLTLQHAMGMRVADLQAWLSDPEEFVLEEEKVR